MTTTNLSLYDVALEGKLIEDILTAELGELTPELEARIDALLLAGKDKIEAAAMVVRTLESNATVCMKEAERISDRAVAFTNQAKRLKDRMTIALDAAFGGKVKTPLFTIWAQSSVPRTSFELAPEFTLEMLREDHPELVRTEYSLDKSKLQEMQKAGDDIPESIIATENPGSRYCRIK